MKTYHVTWKGLDRGHEGAWSPDVWRSVLNAFAKYSPVDLSNANTQFFAELIAAHPEIQWVTKLPNGKIRTFFRDGREPWLTTGVVSFNAELRVGKITVIGKKVVVGELSYSDVLATAVWEHKESCDFPFRIILNALLKVPHGAGLVFDDIIRVMRHYREGDNIEEVLALPVDNMSANDKRRLHAILMLMVYAGLAIQVDERYFPGHNPLVSNVGKTDNGRGNLREEFENWLTDIYKKSNGETLSASSISSYIRALEVSTEPNPDGSPASEHGKVVWHNIYQHLHGTPSLKGVFQVDNVKEFKAIFGKLQLTVGKEGTEVVPHDVIGQHFTEIRQWIAEQSGGAFLPPALTLYEKFLKWQETQQTKNKELPSNVDRLSFALKIFAEKRYEEEWQGKTKSEEHQSIYAMSEMTPEQLSEGSLDDFYNDFLLKVWCFKNGGRRKFAQLDDAEKAAYRQFVVDLKTQLKSFESYFPPDKMCPRGMGVGMLTELMMRFWPKSCCSYNKDLIHDALVVLGMAKGEFVWPSKPSIYQDFMGKCATILRKMEEMSLARCPEPDNDERPDYITVNEFLWFVHDYKDLIQEEVMKKQWKAVNSKERIKKGTLKISKAFENDNLLKRLAAALRAKPFAILAGHSGTGKSQLVRRLAYMTCNNELLVKEGEGKTAPGNYCMVQVKPNWHDSTDLLGYYSEMGGRHFVNTPFVEFICKAYAYPDTPFFVCMDEMNLAPVEQYFAEYLSAIESMEKKGDVWLTDPLVDVDKTGEKDAYGNDKVDSEIVDQIMKGAASTEAAAWIQAHGLTIPKNLFVVGTVNMDETTCQFSRKVLDRAMTLLMNDVRFSTMGQGKKPSEEELLDEDGLKFFLDGEVRGAVGEVESRLLDGLNEPLANTAFVVAYRFANEYALYEAAWAKMMGVDLATAESANKEDLATKALDHVVLMKLLPRIHGERRVVEGIFKGLKAKLPDGLSTKMMDAILARTDEYLTFWP